MFCRISSLGRGGGAGGGWGWSPGPCLARSRQPYCDCVVLCLALVVVQMEEQAHTAALLESLPRGAATVTDAAGDVAIGSIDAAPVEAALSAAYTCTAPSPALRDLIVSCEMVVQLRRRAVAGDWLGVKELAAVAEPGPGRAPPLDDSSFVHRAFVADVPTPSIAEHPVGTRAGLRVHVAALPEVDLLATEAAYHEAERALFGVLKKWQARAVLHWWHWLLVCSVSSVFAPAGLPLLRLRRTGSCPSRLERSMAAATTRMTRTRAAFVC